MTKKLRTAVRLLSLGLLAAAVVRELRRPEANREWHGTVARVVPYELRVPTFGRVKERLWNPEGAVVQPTLFGVGWTLNVGRLVRLVRERRSGRPRR